MKEILILIAIACIATVAVKSPKWIAARMVEAEAQRRDDQVADMWKRYHEEKQRQDLKQEKEDKIAP